MVFSSRCPWATMDGCRGLGKTLWFCCFDVNDYLDLIEENKGMSFIRNFLVFVFRRLVQ
ncbi:GNAT family acetyltransferase domain protein [Serratia plymuthica A30]|nr:GNAT family acetyltransferase domain protein [Serratia plymuthica A30]